jgi:hypothetical protein
MSEPVHKTWSKERFPTKITFDGVPVWCGLFLNREEREVRKDLKAFLRVLPGIARHIVPTLALAGSAREGRCGVLRGKLTW